MGPRQPASPRPASPCLPLKHPQIGNLCKKQSGTGTSSLSSFTSDPVRILRRKPRMQAGHPSSLGGSSAQNRLQVIRRNHHLGAGFKNSRRYDFTATPSPPSPALIFQSSARLLRCSETNCPRPGRPYLDLRSSSLLSRKGVTSFGYEPYIPYPSMLFAPRMCIELRLCVACSRCRVVLSP